MLNTTSMFITFHAKLEDSIEAFYKNLAQNEKYEEVKDFFLKLANENRKHKEMVLRTYREVITDAFEGGFPLKGLNEKEYELKTEITDDSSLSYVLKKAIKLEGINRKFCSDAAESTKGLMADIPQIFERIAHQKTLRIGKIETLK